jgi:signal peptidase II
MRKKDFFLALAGAAASLTALDQGSKFLADRLLSASGTIRVIGDFFILIYARNRGAFLSLGKGTSAAVWPLVFIVMPVVIIAAFVVYLWKRGEYSSYMLCLATLVVAGGLGNIIDRIAFGSVRDFMNLGIGRLRTGIFNAADMYLMAFAAVVVAHELMTAARREKKA